MGSPKMIALDFVKLILALTDVHGELVKTFAPPIAAISYEAMEIQNSSVTHGKVIFKSL